MKIIFFCLNYVICIVENNIFFDILYILAVYSQHILSEGKKSLCEKKITFYTQGIRLFAVRRAQVWMRLKILVDANVVDGTVRACGESTLRGRIEAQSSLGSSLTTSTERWNFVTYRWQSSTGKLFASENHFVYARLLQSFEYAGTREHQFVQRTYCYPSNAFTVSSAKFSVCIATSVTLVARS